MRKGTYRTDKALRAWLGTLGSGLGASEGGRCGRRVVVNECAGRNHAADSFTTTLLPHGQAFAWPPTLTDP